ncbi:MAG: 50S ribosomal protein L15 [Candidatus Yanofskybacteria bacterium GW2011_GWA2_41_22]|nr:MAG: 50S ribosomal protein L15 [Candidatus Yanofskybacteria bacterium GW2011_GWA2_41_22]KKS25734.1 MAG: 50S ribosomal protein L15 [Candidatus Jorgensenbacteria bacterium GW2011_GWF2_41_8]KKS27577.1 MAG: 50S ribosomal protein L15 [Candidatus Yanofskybacteria bacterium GW2011_GWC2_41_9]
MFPKLRGASKKPGNSSPHPKHRFYQLKHDKPAVINLGFLNGLDDGQAVTPELLLEKGLIQSVKVGVKILGDGELKKKLSFRGVKISASAKEKIIKAGGAIE